jgi:hypothetical protein
MSLYREEIDKKGLLISVFGLTIKNFIISMQLVGPRKNAPIRKRRRIFVSCPPSPCKSRRIYYREYGIFPAALDSLFNSAYICISS